MRDVLLSGGDALMVSDSMIEYILQRLRAIEHVEIIRFGSRTPVVLPQRITPELVEISRNITQFGSTRTSIILTK